MVGSENGCNCGVSLPSYNTLLRIVVMEPQRRNIYVVRSVWRRLKKGHIAKVCRDLKPVKDVKGGGVTGKSKPTKGSSDTTTSQ